VIAALGLALATGAGAADPRTNSWFTVHSGRYARIYTNDATKAAGTPATTWNNGTLSQTLPAYTGIQEVTSSASWVYVRSTGLGVHVMGPWYLDAAHTTIFPNLPTNQKLLFRIPRSPAAGSSTLNGGGPIGCFVDGVAMFNSWDAFYWNGSADVASTAGSSGYWNRDAYVNEGPTFDPGYAHQPGSGQYHYHANSPALRYFLGDHVDYTAATDVYSESTGAPTRHSPILAWVQDGYPLYGPYGYASASNSANGLRRMISGYVPRNGQNGTDNLSTNGAARSSIPAWAQRFYSVSAGQSGPTVSSSYPFGRYMEDNAYLGDLTNAASGRVYQQGVDFDLDAYNGRWCVTPEFPQGTYAYFVSISSNGTPVFPYNIGRAFYGSPTGGTLTSIAETVVTNFEGGPNQAPTLSAPKVLNGEVTLTWSAAEGGTYRVESTTNFTAWTTTASNVAAVLDSGSNTNASASPYRFYRVALSGLASYDPVTTSTTTTSGSGTVNVAPPSGNRGTTFTVTATISSSATPSVPPAMAGISSFTIGSLTVSNPAHSSQYVVTGTLTIPSGSATGSQAVSITFSPPPGQTQGPTYTQTEAFTIN
jgi:hypothetical protein